LRVAWLHSVYSTSSDSVQLWPTQPNVQVLGISMRNTARRWGVCKRKFNLRLDLGIVCLSYASHPQ